MDSITETSKTTFDTKPNFEDLRMKLAEFVEERDWNKFHTPRNLVLALVSIRV
jgi:hypothetical protein